MNDDRDLIVGAGGRGRSELILPTVGREQRRSLTHGPRFGTFRHLRMAKPAPDTFWLGLTEGKTAVVMTRTEALELHDTLEELLRLDRDADGS